MSAATFNQLPDLTDDDSSEMKSIAVEEAACSVKHICSESAKATNGGPATASTTTHSSPVLSPNADVPSPSSVSPVVSPPGKFPAGKGGAEADVSHEYDSASMFHSNRSETPAAPALTDGALQTSPENPNSKMRAEASEFVPNISTPDPNHKSNPLEQLANGRLRADAHSFVPTLEPVVGSRISPLHSFSQPPPPPTWLGGCRPSPLNAYSAPSMGIPDPAAHMRRVPPWSTPSTPHAYPGPPALRQPNPYASFTPPPPTHLPETVSSEWRSQPPTILPYNQVAAPLDMLPENSLAVQPSGFSTSQPDTACHPICDLSQKNEQHRLEQAVPPGSGYSMDLRANLASLLFQNTVPPVSHSEHRINNSTPHTLLGGTNSLPISQLSSLRSFNDESSSHQLDAPPPLWESSRPNNPTGLRQAYSAAGQVPAPPPPNLPPGYSLPEVPLHDSLDDQHCSRQQMELIHGTNPVQQNQASPAPPLSYLSPRSIPIAGQADAILPPGSKPLVPPPPSHDMLSIPPAPGFPAIPTYRARMDSTVPDFLRSAAATAFNGTAPTCRHPQTQSCNLPRRDIQERTPSATSSYGARPARPPISQDLQSPGLRRLPSAVGGSPGVDSVNPEQRAAATLRGQRLSQNPLAAQQIAAVLTDMSAQLATTDESFDRSIPNGLSRTLLDVIHILHYNAIHNVNGLAEFLATLANHGCGQLAGLLASMVLRMIAPTLAASGSADPPFQQQSPAGHKKAVASERQGHAAELLKQCVSTSTGHVRQMGRQSGTSAAMYRIQPNQANESFRPVSLSPFPTAPRDTEGSAADERRPGTSPTRAQQRTSKGTRKASVQLPVSLLSVSSPTNGIHYSHPSSMFDTSGERRTLSPASIRSEGLSKLLPHGRDRRCLNFDKSRSAKIREEKIRSAPSSCRSSSSQIHLADYCDGNSCSPVSSGSPTGSNLDSKSPGAKAPDIRTQEGCPRPHSFLRENEHRWSVIDIYLRCWDMVDEDSSREQIAFARASLDDSMRELIRETNDASESGYFSEPETKGPTRIPIRSPTAHFVGHRPEVQLRTNIPQFLTEDFDALVAGLLREAKTLDAQLKWLPFPLPHGQPRRSLALGLREIARGIRNKRVTMMVAAPDIEEASSDGGLGDRVQIVMDLAQRFNVPVVFALSRSRIGRALGKQLRMSVVGLLSMRGTQTPQQVLKRALTLRKVHALCTENGLPPTERAIRTWLRTISLDGLNSEDIRAAE